MSCPAIKGEVMVRAYRKDGTFYRGGWSSLLTLWDQGYLIPMITLQKKGRATMMTQEGSIEFILIS